MKKLFILTLAFFCAKLSNSTKQWHLDKKRIKNGSSCASKKPEVTIKPYDKVITKDAYLMMIVYLCIG
jgi:hypothetical protein